MYTFFKSNVAAIAASMLDYLVTFLLVQIFHSAPLVGSVAGTASGGVLNFAMGRNWVFSATAQGVKGQAIKYLLVWVGSFVLNQAGFLLLYQFMGLHYMIAKVGVSVFIGISYNYLLQKTFVFAHSRVPQQTL